MNVLSLFSTPVARFSFPRKLTEQEFAFFTKQDCTPNEGNTTSTNKNILDCSDVKDVSDWIQEKTKQYFQEIHSPKNDIEIYITQSWLNYTEQGQYHHKHNHACSFVSGCFYVDTDSETDKIYFFNETYSNHNILQFDIKEYNAWNSTSWWIPVSTGDLILFPSSLTHMVAPKEAPGTRVSLAFNTFLRGQLGNVDSLTGLYL